MSITKILAVILALLFMQPVISWAAPDFEISPNDTLNLAPLRMDQAVIVKRR